MRTLSLPTKIISACALALGVVMSLGLPWYGRAEATVISDPDVGEFDSSLRQLFGGASRWFGERGGVSGWDAMSQLDLALVAFALITFASAIACWAPALEHAGRAALRVSSLAMLAIVLVRLFDQPGDNSLLEPRYGGFVALGCTAMLSIVASNIASAKLRRRPQAPLPRRSARASA